MCDAINVLNLQIRSNNFPVITRLITPGPGYEPRWNWARWGFLQIGEGTSHTEGQGFPIQLFDALQKRQANVSSLIFQEKLGNWMFMGNLLMFKCWELLNKLKPQCMTSFHNPLNEISIRVCTGLGPCPLLSTGFVYAPNEPLGHSSVPHFSSSCLSPSKRVFSTNSL